MKHNIPMEYLQLIKRMQDQDRNLTLGGSIGLHLLGYNIEREWGTADLDFTTSTEFNMAAHPGLVNVDDKLHASADMDYFMQDTVTGIKVQVQDDTRHHFYEVETEVGIIRVRAAEEIIAWKVKYALGEEGNVAKHVKDLVTMGEQHRLNKPQWWIDSFVKEFTPPF